MKSQIEAACGFWYNFSSGCGLVEGGMLHQSPWLLSTEKHLSRLNTRVKNAGWKYFHSVKKTDIETKYFIPYVAPSEISTT